MLSAGKNIIVFVYELHVSQQRRVHVPSITTTSGRRGDENERKSSSLFSLTLVFRVSEHPVDGSITEVCVYGHSPRSRAHSCKLFAGKGEDESEILKRCGLGGVRGCRTLDAARLPKAALIEPR